MKNRTKDVHDHVIAQMERLTDESLSADELAAEVARSKAVAELAGRSVEIGRLALDSARLAVDHGRDALPPMLDHRPALGQ